MSARTANCPSCGAPLEFRNAATLLVVCASCGGASWRSDVDLELLGKVAEVAPLESLLGIGTRGRFEGKGWTAVGQVQLDHGRGPWNEWCLLFDDGSWGWLAEAQGEILLTRPRKPGPVPPHDRLRPGEAVDLGDAGHFVAAEVGRATVTAVRGELPIRAKPGTIRLYADLRSGAKGFATLDYGDDRNCDEAFVGAVVSPEEVGLDPSKAPAGAERRAAADRIQCGKCGGEVRLRDPGGAVRVACGSCGSLLDATDRDAAVIGAAGRVRAAPRIPLGARGRLRGLAVECIAFLERSVTVEGTRYPWHEYLLKASGGKGYRWLAESKGHWSFIEPLSPGEVKVSGPGATCRGTEFRHFQGGRAVLDLVYGEVYWQATVGETVKSDDYVAPPLAVTLERDEKEVNATLGTYVEPPEVQEAFALKEPLQIPVGVAPSQPNPLQGALGKWWGACLAAAAADLVLTLAFSASDRESFGFPCCLSLPVLLLPAVVAATRSSSFERNRWMESDHPPASYGGDDE